MNESIKAVSLTTNKIVILRTLESSPAKWSVLRRAYFGERRALQPASTSFYTQSKAMIGAGRGRDRDRPRVRPDRLGHDEWPRPLYGSIPDGVRGASIQRMAGQLRRVLCG